MTEEATSINAAAVRLPPYSPNQPLTWFRRAERHFHLKKITSSTTKADYAIEVLPESVFQHIASWLDTQPAEIQYEDLKAALLRMQSVLHLPFALVVFWTFRINFRETAPQHRHGITSIHCANCRSWMQPHAGLPKQLDPVKEI